MCFAFHISSTRLLVYHDIPNEGNIPAEKKALANGGSKDGLLFSGGRTIRWPRTTEATHNKECGVSNKTFKDAVSAV